jgi:hypothetical protein
MNLKDNLSHGLGFGAAALLVVASVGAVAIGPAQATTGNADGLPEPKILVNPAIGDAYIGRFYLSRIERRAGLVSAVLDVDYTESVEHEFMVGDGEFYQYNAQGSLTSWTASLYPYVYKNGLMTCNLLVPGTTTKVLGKLVLDKPINFDTPAHPNQETLNGKLTIAHKTYAATFRQVEDDDPTPATLPKAVQTGAAAASSPEIPAVTLESHSSTSSTAEQGVYASVVRLTNALT